MQRITTSLVIKSKLTRINGYVWIIFSPTAPPAAAVVSSAIFNNHKTNTAEQKITRKIVWKICQHAVLSPHCLPVAMATARSVVAGRLRLIFLDTARVYSKSFSFELWVTTAVCEVGKVNIPRCVGACVFLHCNFSMKYL